MVKADVKHNYYADLELPTSASIDDIRKAYRKLALQHHPDRNSGREDECVPRFQAIQAANEVLGDPASKQKYDNDRRKAGLFPTGATYNPRQPAPGNPYAANSAFPPPPRRTQPSAQWGRPPPPPQPAPSNGAGPGPGPVPTGADRFAPFMRAAPTARKEPPRETAQNHQRTWDHIRQPKGNAVPPRPQPQQPQPQPSQPQQVPPRPPPPPRPNTNFPSEEKIRSGYNNVPRDADLDRRRTQFQQFHQTNASKPGVTRTNSVRTPNRQGFNPNNVSGSDEKPSGSHHMHRNRSADFGPPQSRARVPPPSSGAPLGTSPTTPRSPASPTSNRPFPNITQPYSGQTPNDQAPFSEWDRIRTPYGAPMHEKTDLGDGLRRSYSVRDTTKLGPEGTANGSRARSTSPLGRQPQDGQRTPGAARFNVYSEDEDSDDSTTQVRDGVSGLEFSNEQHRPGTAPNSRPPLERPKAVPTPPSRFGAAQGSSSRPNTGDGVQSNAEQPSMQQRSSSNMYENPLSSSPIAEQTNGANSALHSTLRARRTWSKAGRWALPSSVSPFAKLDKEPVVPSQQHDGDKTFVTAADPIFVAAREDEKNAYMRFQYDLAKEYEQVPSNLDMEVFLKLASTARKGISCGRRALDKILLRIFEDFPSVGFDLSNRTDNKSTHSFAFARNPDLVAPNNAKSRSEENINTNFSPEGWTGTFTGGQDYFAPPLSTGRKSPSRRTTRTPKEQTRSATMDMPSSNTPQEEVPSRPWGSDGTPKGMPSQPAPGEARFSTEEWQFPDASWAMPPPPPRQSSPVKGGATPNVRKASQGRKASKATLPRSADMQQPSQPSVVDEDDTTAAGSANHQSKMGAPTDDVDAMDIDDTPPAGRNANEQQNAQSQSTDKEARLYSVQPSVWRQQQAQTQQTTPNQRNTPFTSKRAQRVSTNDGTTLNANLDDLRNVEPIAKSAPGASGLNDLGSMTSNLPFKSEAARNISKSSALPQQFELPASPKVPPEPARLSRSSWQAYAKQFGDYCVAFHNFNNAMLRHFNTWEMRCETRFVNGVGWLEAAGDTSGMSSEVSGFGSYLAETAAMERTREYWNVGCEKHTLGLKEFDKIRERVRRLAWDAVLPDV